MHTYYKFTHNFVMLPFFKTILSGVVFLLPYTILNYQN